MLVGLRASVDARDDQGASALIWAARTGRDQVVSALLALRADPLVQDNTGSTALHTAARFAQRYIMALIVMFTRTGSGPSTAVARVLAASDGWSHSAMRAKDAQGLTALQATYAHMIHALCSVWIPRQVAAALHQETSLAIDEVQASRAASRAASRTGSRAASRAGSCPTSGHSVSGTTSRISSRSLSATEDADAVTRLPDPQGITGVGAALVPDACDACAPASYTRPGPLPQLSATHPTPTTPANPGGTRRGAPPSAP